MESDPKSQSTVTPHCIPENPMHPFRILLAEDVPLNQEIALSFLHKIGVAADVAENGKKAVELLEKNPYDLVLMDLHMEEMDGFEATRIIRDQRSNVLDHDIPVIAITAHATAGVKQKCLKIGMNGYLSKPLTPDTLYRELLIHLPVKKNVTDQIALPTQTFKTTDEKPEKRRERSVFNEVEFMNRIGGDQALFKRLLNIFFETMPHDKDQLQRLLDGNDVELIKSQVHRIKSAFAYISAHTLQDIMLEIETALKQNDIEKSRSLFKKLEPEFDKLSREVVHCI